MERKQERLILRKELKRKSKLKRAKKVTKKNIRTKQRKIKEIEKEVLKLTNLEVQKLFKRRSMKGIVQLDLAKIEIDNAVANIVKQ